MRLTRAQREEVRARFDGRCAYCGCVLSDRWHADHHEPVGRDTVLDGNRFVFRGEVRNAGADRIENLFPSCAPCNIDKGPDTVENWRWRLARSAELLRRDVPKFRHAERFKVVTVSDDPIRFYFETNI